jgi:Na+-driven multidrug efflux pump
LKHKLSRFFTTIAQAIRGDDYDFTQGSIRKGVFLLAIPMILELSLESVFAVVDIFFVSKLGSGAVAAVGLTESVITLIYSVAIGLSTAATAIVARRVGEKNNEAASHAGAQTIVIALIITTVLSLIGCAFASTILGLMGALPKALRLHKSCLAAAA